jgi:hypothetical protein
MFNKTLVAALCFVFGLSASSRATCDQVCAELRLGQDSAPPGIPVSISLTLTNASDHEVAVANAFELVVKRMDDTIYVAQPGTESSAVGMAGSDVREFRLAPHASRLIVAPSDAFLGGPAWFRDARLTEPGEQQLTLKYFYRAEGRSQTATSRPANFTVAFENDADRAVWARLLERASGPWTILHWAALNSEIAAEIARDFPRSSYAFYSAMMIAEPDLAERMNRLRGLITRFPDHPFSDALRVSVAQLEILSARQLRTATDAKQAHALLGDAASLLQAVAAKGRDEGQREAARRALRDMPSVDSVVRDLL